jgi:hypothetical protein
MGNGSGTAQLTFGSTVFNFNIQVAPNAQVFNRGGFGHPPIARDKAES